MKNRLYLLLFLLTLSFGARAQSGCMCVQLDGSNEYLHTAYANYNFANYTMELWIKVPTYTTNIHYISLYQNAYLVLGDYDQGSFSTWADGLAPIDIGPSSMISTLNVWHHVAFTYDGAFQKIYIDGVLDRNVATTGLVNINTVFNQGLTVGARYTNSIQFVNGLLDEVRLWNVARTQGQIQASMSQALVGNEPGLVSYWDMNDGPGSPIASDRTANNNDLSLYNMELNLDWVNQCPFIATTPFTYTIAPNDTICEGDTLLLSVSGRDSMIWSPNTYLNVDTGSTVQFFPPVTSTVTVLGWKNGNSTPDTVHITVHVLPASHVNASTSICQGDSIFLGGAYQTSSGTYVDEYTNMLGCDSIVTTILNVTPNVTTLVNQSICSGDSLFVGGGFQHAAGTYTDNFTSVAGCDSTVVTNLAVTVVDTSVTALSFSSFSANATPATYVWMECIPNPTPLGTAQVFFPTYSGQFMVQVTQNGCTAVSGCQTALIESIDGNSLGAAIRLYPNPLRNEVYIEFIDAHEDADYVLMDALGRQIARGVMPSDMQKAKVDMQAFASGLYYVKISAGSASGTFQLVKE